MKPSFIQKDQKPFKDLFFVEKIERIKKRLLTFRGEEKGDLRRDAKSVICRGIEQEEIEQVQKGLKLEDIFFYLSRAYIPCVFYYAFKKGHFEERMTSQELKRVAKYGIHMFLIANFGHFMLQYYANPIIEKHRGFSEYELQRRANDDFIVQREYFKEKEILRNSKSNKD